jgi:hypothetical protein
VGTRAGGRGDGLGDGCDALGAEYTIVAASGGSTVTNGLSGCWTIFSLMIDC